VVIARSFAQSPFELAYGNDGEKQRSLNRNIQTTYPAIALPKRHVDFHDSNPSRTYPQKAGTLYKRLKSQKILRGPEQGKADS